MSGYLTIDEARDRLRRATEIILSLEGKYAEANERAADAEGVYRYEVGEAFRRYREAGEAATAAETLARADCAVQKRESLAAAGALKLAAEKLENARDTRRSLWRIVEWSRDHALLAERSRNGPAQQSLSTSPPPGFVVPENAPRERWP